MIFSGRLISIFARFKPVDDLGGEFLLGLGTHIDADMAGIEAHIFGVPAAHYAGDLLGCFRRHQMVILSIDVEHGHGDFPQVDMPPSDHQPVLDQEVFLVQILSLIHI